MAIPNPITGSITINYHETTTASATNTFSTGNLPIENVYFGTQEVKKIYLGNSLVWEKEVEIPENALLAQDGALLTSDGGYLITTEITLISFAIGTMSGDLSCQAEDGMTWAEWVNSEYNTGGFIVFDNSIFTPSRTGYIPGVTSSDIIVAGRYVINYGGSAD